MPNVKQIQNEIDSIRTIKTISSALLEVSAAKIQQIRTDFDHNQRFFEEISELYNTVEVSATRQRLKQDAAEGRRKKKTISVVVTSNRGFYGLLNTNVIDAFLEHAHKTKGDFLVIGNIGKRYLEQSDIYSGSTFLSFKNDYPTAGETKIFLEKVKKYDHVLVMYPKFVSIFSQDIGLVDITHTPTKKVDPTKELEYIFEPDLVHIVSFFETQVRHMLFMRIMLESELSRLAARLVKMTSTEERADDMIRLKQRAYRKEMAAVNDIKLLESFSGLKKWEIN